MELKHYQTMFTTFEIECFNRTFMELKLNQMARYEAAGIVLIGPSWN